MVENAQPRDDLITDSSARDEICAILERRRAIEAQRVEAANQIGLVDRRLEELAATVAAAEGGKLPLHDPRPAGRLALLLSGMAVGPDPAEVQRRRDHNAVQQALIDDTRQDIALLEEERRRAQIEHDAAERRIEAVNGELHATVADALFITFQQEALALVERRLRPLRLLKRRFPGRALLMERLSHVEINWRETRPSPVEGAPDRPFTRTIWPANGADDSETAEAFLSRVVAEIDGKGSAKRTRSVEDGRGH
ncbi:hypothetical protein [Inquilinus sp. OTU3971]|uniref:hypothetical protein n=1 Tax=Inquilinus sp. OTU3971 TaxID=3043855 RepID=UPI00313DB3A9